MRLNFSLDLVRDADFVRSFDLWLSETMKDDLTGATVAASLQPRGFVADPVSMTTENGRVFITLKNRLRLQLDRSITRDMTLGDWWLSVTVSYPTGYDRPFVEGPVRAIRGV